jgi:hypothetical protein
VELTGNKASNLKKPPVEKEEVITDLEEPEAVPD